MPDPTLPNPDTPLWRKAAPVLFLLLWSGGFVFVKLGLQYAQPLTFLALRFACVGVILMLPFLWLRPQVPDSRSGWMHLAIVGVLMQPGYLCGTYLSMKNGMSAGAVALITCQQPILIGLLAPIFAHERFDVRRWAGLVLGVGGACLVIVANASIKAASLAGVMFSVLALFALTAGTLWEKRFGAPVHPVTAGIVQCLVGLAISLPLALSLETLQLQWAPGLMLSLAYLVLGTSIVAISLLLAMIRHGEASRVSALFFLVPPVTAVIAALALGESVPALAWLGMALAAVGIHLVMRT